MRGLLKLKGELEDINEGAARGVQGSGSHSTA